MTHFQKRALYCGSVATEMSTSSSSELSVSYSQHESESLVGKADKQMALLPAPYKFEPGLISETDSEFSNGDLDSDNDRLHDLS